MGKMTDIAGLLLMFTIAVGAQRGCPTVYPRRHVETFGAVRTENIDSLESPLYEMDVFEDDLYDNVFQVSIKAYGSARPVRDFITVAEESSHGNCGSGTFQAPEYQHYDKQVSGRCPHVVSSTDGTDKDTITFQWMPPKCGCVTIRTSVMPSQDEFYIDDSHVDTGPLTKTVCLEDDLHEPDDGDDFDDLDYEVLGQLDDDLNDELDYLEDEILDDLDENDLDDIVDDIIDDDNDNDDDILPVLPTSPPMTEPIIPIELHPHSTEEILDDFSDIHEDPVGDIDLSDIHGDLSDTLLGDDLTDELLDDDFTDELFDDDLTDEILDDDLTHETLEDDITDEIHDLTDEIVDDSHISDVDHSDVLDDSDDHSLVRHWKHFPRRMRRRKLFERPTIKSWRKNKKQHKKLKLKRRRVAKKTYKKLLSGRKPARLINKKRKITKKIQHLAQLKKALVKKQKPAKRGQSLIFGRKLAKRVRRSLANRRSRQDRKLAKICHKARYIPDQPTRRFHRKWQTKSEADRNAIWSKRVTAVKTCCQNMTDTEGTRQCFQKMKEQKIDIFCLDDSNPDSALTKQKHREVIRKTCCNLQGEAKYGCFDRTSVHFWKKQQRRTKKVTKKITRKSHKIGMICKKIELKERPPRKFLAQWRPHIPSWNERVALWKQKRDEKLKCCNQKENVTDCFVDIKKRRIDHICQTDDDLLNIPLDDDVIDNIQDICCLKPGDERYSCAWGLEMRALKAQWYARKAMRKQRPVIPLRPERPVVPRRVPAIRDSDEHDRSRSRSREVPDVDSRHSIETPDTNHSLQEDAMERKCCAAGLATKKKFANIRRAAQRRICLRKAQRIAKKLWPQRPTECQEDYVECCV